MGQGIEAGAQGARAVVTGDDDGDFGGLAKLKPWGGFERILDGVEGGLGPAIDMGQAEAPAFDLASVLEPLVSKAEDDRAGETGAEAGFDLPGEDFAFAGFAFLDGVDAELADDEGPGVGLELEAGEVGLVGAAVVEVDVIAEEVDLLGLKEFGGGEIGKGAEAFGVDGLGFEDEFVDEFGDGFGAAPAGDLGGYFVDDAVGEDGGVADVRLNGVADGGANFAAQPCGIEEAAVFVPRDVDEQAEALLDGEVEEPAGGQAVDAEEVGAEFGKLTEIVGGLLRGRKPFLPGIGSEGAVGDTFEEELLIADAKEFAVRADTQPGWISNRHSDCDWLNRGSAP